MFPIWAKIDFDFDQEKIKQELLENNILENSMVATTNYNEKGNSIWDPEGTLFSEKIFEKQKEIHHYKNVDDGRLLVKGNYNTFRMLNLTYLPEKTISKQDLIENFNKLL